MLPSYVWYQDMADFAETISDEAVGRRLARAIHGKGANVSDRVKVGVVRSWRRLRGPVCQPLPAAVDAAVDRTTVGRGGPNSSM
jgi:hypothetical protein